MAQIKANEITQLIRQQIENYEVKIVLRPLHFGIGIRRGQRIAAGEELIERLAIGR